MATKVIEVVVCDLAHKHDRPAVDRVTIDVCAQHAEALRASTQQFHCTCGRGFSKKQGLVMHQTRTGHKPVKAA